MDGCRPEWEYKIALSMMRGVDAEVARHAVEAGISLEEFFGIPVGELSDRLGLNAGVRLQQMERDEALSRARAEMKNLVSRSITVTSIMDEDYPERLYETAKAPLILYRVGECPLDGEHMLSIVGTRGSTAYGVAFVRKVVGELAVYFPDMVVVSGLAYGIDAAAHEAALANGLRTIGVVAHGVHKVYPAAHTELARRMVRNGGAIVTEYPVSAPGHQRNFLERNRIVAALPDGVLVAESDIKGGAMSTAATAGSYGREVMALPGRVTDATSRGCNHLIRTDKARLVTSTADIMEALGWQPEGMRIDLRQRNLFPELEGDTRRVYELLRYEPEPMAVDTIRERLGLAVSALTGLLGDMEFDGLVMHHPGNRYSAVL